MYKSSAALAPARTDGVTLLSAALAVDGVNGVAHDNTHCWSDDRAVVRRGRRR